MSDNFDHADLASPSASSVSAGNHSAPIEVLAHQRIADDVTYALHFREVTYHSRDGVLILRGRVPTFYLKQVLQTLLCSLNGIDQIENEVDVADSDMPRDLSQP